jgi:hypothetical protein
LESYAGNSFAAGKPNFAERVLSEVPFKERGTLAVRVGGWMWS